MEAFIFARWISTQGINQETKIIHKLREYQLIQLQKSLRATSLSLMQRFSNLLYHGAIKVEIKEQRK